MASPTTVQNGEQSGPLDIALEYGILLAVVTYAVGLVAERATASRLGFALADFLLADRRILISGGSILLGVALCVGMSAYILSLLHRKGAPRWLSLTIVLLLPVLYWGALWLLRGYGTSLDHTNWEFLAYAVMLNLAATWMCLSSYQVLRPLPQLHQAALLALILSILVLLSAESGDLAAKALLQGPKVHLLVDAESVAGARQLGISFLEARWHSRTTLRRSSDCLLRGTNLADPARKRPHGAIQPRQNLGCGSPFATLTDS